MTMMNKIEPSGPFRLTPACEEYIRKVLSSGRSLARVIESELNLGDGTIHLIPDPGYEKLTAEQFHNGGVW